jgi:hypothetical protein
MNNFQTKADGNVKADEGEKLYFHFLQFMDYLHGEKFEINSTFFSGKGDSTFHSQFCHPFFNQNGGVFGGASTLGQLQLIHSQILPFK